MPYIYRIQKAPLWGNVLVMATRKLIVVMLIALLTAAAGSASAQFWKKKDRRHRYRHTDSTAVATAPQTDEPEVVDHREVRIREKMERRRLRRERRRMRHHSGSNDDMDDIAANRRSGRKSKKKKGFVYPETVMKPSYRIDLLANLYLDELAKKGELAFNGKIPDKAYPGITFYEGMNIAADSLRKAGYNIDIFVHDIATDAESLDKLVANGRLDSADLIIGAYHSLDMAAIADYARSKHINFVSALSPADGGVTGNPYFTLTQPTLKTHCEWIIGDVSAKYAGNNVLLIRSKGSQADENAFGYLNKANSGSLHFKQLICGTVPEKENIEGLIDTSGSNVVIVSVLEPGFADSLLTELSGDFPNARFEVYGMPSWYVIDDLHDKSAFPNMGITLSEPFSYDQSAPLGKYVARRFKNDYGGKPSELVYRGFETLFWYASLLKKYGTIFNPNYSSVAAPFTVYDMQLKKDKDDNILYSENTHIYRTYYGNAAGNSVN